MLAACLPFGPSTTSKVTRSPSFRVLKPFMVIAEKWAKRSSPPPSGVMKPKPFASLNHLTVPNAILLLPSGRTDLFTLFQNVAHRVRRHSSLYRISGMCLFYAMFYGSSTNFTNFLCCGALTYLPDSTG